MPFKSSDVFRNVISPNILRGVFEGAVTPAFDPATLFALGEEGAWYEAFDISTLFQDSAGTTPVTAASDPVGLMTDKSGNNVDAAQSVSAARPTYETGPARLTMDKIDDRLVATVPAIDGTMILSTPEGTAAYGVDISAGSYDIGGRGGDYFPGTALVGQILRDGAMTQPEIDAAITYFRANGGGNNYGAVTNFTQFWRDWDEITSFPLIDTSSGTDFQQAWYGCSSLATFPLIDTSSGTSLNQAWRDCSSLTSFPLIDTSSGTNFTETWRGCSSLTAFPALDVSSGTTFAGAFRDCSSLTSFPLIDTSSGTNFGNAWRGCSSLTAFPLIDTSSGTTLNQAWYGCSSLTSFPLIDTSSGTNFTQAWYGCSSLTAFPALDLSSGTNFSQAWRNCSSLTTFPANMFDSVTATNFTNAFNNTALNQTSIDNILVSINTANTSNGTFFQSGGSAPSATGEAAIDALRARGWTVTVTGGY